MRITSPVSKSKSNEQRSDAAVLRAASRHALGSNISPPITEKPKSGTPDDPAAGSVCVGGAGSEGGGGGSKASAWDIVVCC